MLIVHSRNGVPVRLTDERWQHIVRRHPEMSGQQQAVLETLNAPDMIQEGDYGELLALRFYFETPLTSKFLVVAYREVNLGDGFVITAYLTSRPLASRRILWKQ